MDGEKGFNHAFGMSRTNLGVVGLWPLTTKKKTGEVVPFALFGISIIVIIIFINIAQTTKLVMIWGDLNGMIDNISTANLPIAVVVIKICYREVLGDLLSEALADWCSRKSPKEVDNMRRSAAMAHNMSLICVCLGFGSVNGQMAVRVGQELDIVSGQTERRLPMVSSYFPYDCKSSPIYEMTWLLQYSGAALATLVYSGAYCLFVGLVLHLRGQVANMRHRLETLEACRGNDRSVNGKEFRRSIGIIIERHMELNRFAQGIESIFNLMFLAELVSCTVQICLQVFLLVTLISDEYEGLPILQILFMIIYVLHVGTHVYICCYAADKLRDESLSISTSAYNCLWYNLPPRDAKLLIFVMHRANEPLQVTAGKFCAFSLRLYAQILKTSGGYLSMLLAVKDRS